MMKAFKTETLLIGKVAKQTGVGVETIRYYERQGLLPEPARGDGGYRLYPQETVRRVRFIRRAKWLGFTLKEIGQLLGLRDSTDVHCADVRQHAEAKLEDIDRRVKELEAIREVLLKLVNDCGAGGAVGECPILDALED